MHKQAGTAFSKQGGFRGSCADSALNATKVRMSVVRMLSRSAVIAVGTTAHENPAETVQNMKAR